MTMQILERLDHFVLRLQFGPSARVKFYETLAILMESGVLLNDAFREIYMAESDDGEKPRSAKALIVGHCMVSIADGRPLSHALAPWVSPEESALLSAGERSGRLVDDRDGPGAFSQAINVISAKQEIVGAVATATVYPSVLAALTVYLLSNISGELVPKLSRTTNPEQWTGAASLLYQMSEFIRNHGAELLVVVLLLVASVFLSLPYLCGAIRVRLDRFPPWSVYRMLHGATFLLSVAALLRAGIKMQDALTQLANNASPWLRERIEGARHGIAVGQTLGVALKEAGHGFPDRDTVRLMVILSGRHGFEETIAAQSERWMKDSIKKIQGTAKASLAAGLMVIGALMLFVLSGIGGIQDAIQAGVK